jgi:hypothetical protein
MPFSPVLVRWDIATENSVDGEGNKSGQWPCDDPRDTAFISVYRVTHKAVTH